jgi:Uma2 family endonuclease
MAMPLRDCSWTATRRDALPEDGNRYEVIDGVLYVTPSPSVVHQWAAPLLGRLLFDYADPLGLLAFGGPIDVYFGERNAVEPDLSVIPTRNGKLPSHYKQIRRLILAVEVLSPSTERRDRTVKLALFQREDVDEYWMVDVHRRVVDRWRRGMTEVETMTESIVWQPIADAPPLVIDLPAFFRKVHRE